MAFVPGYENDVFISYSHIDNFKSVNAKIGWVDVFEEILRQRLFLRCSSQVKVFRDPELRVLGEFSQQLVNAISSTAAFISILSNPYVESEWCLRELRQFVDSGGLERIIKVEKSAIDEIADPEVAAVFSQIKDVLNCKFYEQIGNTTRYRDLMPDVKPEDIAACYDKIDVIAQDLSKLLRELRKARLAMSPVAASAEDTETEIEKDLITVYLAETTADVDQQRMDIRTELLQFNCRILPAHPLPSDSDAMMKAVREALEQSSLAIHLLGSDYGRSTPGGKSVPHVQYELARDVARTGGLVQMVWTPDDASQKDDQQARLLEQVRNATPEFLRAKIEDFKSEIVKKLKVENVDTAGNAEDDQVNVSLFCHVDDRKSVGPLFNYLTLNEFFEVNVQSDTQLKPATDGVLLYYGNADEKWFVNSWKLIQRQSSTSRSKPVLAKAIYAGEPSTPEKNLLQSDDLVIIKNYGQFNPDSLVPFVDRIKGAKGEAQ
jgi:hypothetical protein